MYSLIKGFLSPTECGIMLEVAEAFIANHYNENNVKEHKAYISDIKPNRTSYGFALDNCAGLPNYSQLPNIDKEQLPVFLRDITEKVSKALGIFDGRALFNIQRYNRGSAQVPRHFDGELFDFDVGPEGELNINKALRPGEVAVLTLVNEAIGGGTRLFPLDSSPSFVVPASAGDLLIFSNTECDHGVDSFYGSQVGQYLRYIVGWRALEDGCHMFSEGIIHPERLSYRDAVAIHTTYLRDEWPKKYEALTAPF